MFTLKNHYKQYKRQRTPGQEAPINPKLIYSQDAPGKTTYNVNSAIANDKAEYTKQAKTTQISEQNTN